MDPKQPGEGVVPAEGKKPHQHQQRPKTKNPRSTSSQLNTVDPPASVGGVVTAPKPMNYGKKRKLETKRVVETRAQAPDVDAPIVAQSAEDPEIGNEDGKPIFKQFS